MPALASIPKFARAERRSKRLFQQRYLNAEIARAPNICSDGGPWAIFGGDVTTGYLEQNRLNWK
jgi:hypothetical protein